MLLHTQAPLADQGRLVARRKWSHCADDERSQLCLGCQNNSFWSTNLIYSQCAGNADSVIVIRDPSDTYVGRIVVGIHDFAKTLVPLILDR